METLSAPSPAIHSPSRSSTDQAYGIVLGCPRSGTTYLSRLLTTIPEFECTIGTILPVTIPHVVNQPLSPDVYDALAVGFERALDDYLHSGRYHSRAMALQKWINTPTGLRGLMQALRGEREQPACMIYKEPFLAFSPEFVLDAFPNDKILHIYRDGRDCAHSLVESYDVLTDEKLSTLQSAEARLGRRCGDRFVPWWVEEGREREFLNSTPYVRSIWMWAYMVRRCHNAFSRPEVQDSERVMVLSYEDLVREPNTHGQAVVEFFGGTPSRALKRLLANARTSSIGKHKHRDPAEIAEAERIAHDELQLYGYLD